jgi:ATP-binding cassette subfamily A (ABC1) protein 1
VCQWNQWDNNPDASETVCYNKGVCVNDSTGVTTHGSHQFSGMNAGITHVSDSSGCPGGTTWKVGECLNICEKTQNKYLFGPPQQGRDPNWESRSGENVREACDALGAQCRMTVPPEGVDYEIEPAWLPSWREFKTGVTESWEIFAKLTWKSEGSGAMTVGLGLGTGGGMIKQNDKYPWRDLNSSDFNALPGDARICTGNDDSNAWRVEENKGPTQRLELFAATLKENNLIIAIYPDNATTRAFYDWVGVKMPALALSSSALMGSAWAHMDMPSLQSRMRFFASSKLVDEEVRREGHGSGASSERIVAALSLEASAGSNNVKITIRPQNFSDNYVPGDAQPHVTLTRSTLSLPFTYLVGMLGPAVCDKRDWQCNEGYYTREKMPTCQLDAQGNISTMGHTYSLPSVGALQMLLDKYVINKQLTNPTPARMLEYGVCSTIDRNHQLVATPRDSLANACVHSLFKNTVFGRGYYSCRVHWRDAKECKITGNPSQDCPAGGGLAGESEQYQSGQGCQQNCVGPSSCMCYHNYRRCDWEGDRCGYGPVEQDQHRKIVEGLNQHEAGGPTTGLVGGFSAAYNALPSNKKTAVDAAMGDFVQINTYFPQSVRVMPFPVAEYKTDPFYSSAVPQVMTTLFVVAFTVPVFNMIKRLVFEKESRIREGMQMMGLASAAVAISWILSYLSRFTFHAVVVSILLSQGVINGVFAAPLPLIFLLFLSFGLNSACFCYMIAQSFDRAATASILGAVLFFAAFVPSFIVSSSWSVTQKTLVGLFPGTGLSMGIDYCKLVNANFVTIDWTNFSDLHESYSLGHAIRTLLLGALLWTALGWYFNHVLPSEFGVRSPPWFCLLPRYWGRACGLARGKAVAPGDGKAPLMGAAADGGADAAEKGLGPRGRSPSPDGGITPADVEALYGDPRHADSENFERLTSQQEQLLRRGDCLHIRGLTKVFSTADGTLKVANDNLHAAFFKGEIFVLLGHNGAGKTTALSQLCGLIAPTSGDARIFGMSIKTQMAEIRKKMGVCPQMNVLYDELTVNEHMILYARIKGIEKAAREAAVLKVLAGVALTEKRHAFTRNLSGGQKRKACLAIALIGDSPILMLDEPTSGMDVFAQRSTWNMLQKSREGRITVLTTHSMEEADVLADRIGIMSEGRMICCGTPIFLKRRYGVGYSMVCTAPAMGQEGGAKTASNLVELVQRHVPEAKMVSNLGQEMSFQLPLGAGARFEALFAEMDALKERDPSQLSSFNVSVTTVEEVFIKSAQGANRKQAEADRTGGETKAGGGTKAGPTAAEAKGRDPNDGRKRLKRMDTTAFNAAAKKRSAGTCGQLAWHVVAMLLKRFSWFRRDFKSILYIVVGPLLLVSLGLYALTTTNPFSDPVTPSTKFFNPRGAGTLAAGSTLFPMARFAGAGARAEAASLAAARLGVAAAATQLESEHKQVDASVSADPVADYAGSTCSSVFHIEEGGGSPDNRWNVQVCPDGDDAGSWHCATSKWLEALPETRADSVYGAWGILPPVEGMKGSDADNLWYDLVLMTNQTATHGVPLFQSVLDTAFWKHLDPANAGDIEVTVHKLPKTLAKEDAEKQDLTFVIVFLIGLAFSLVPAPIVEFIVRERSLGFKHQQLVSGVSLIAYWATAWLWDVLLYLVPGLGTIFILTLWEEDLASFTGFAADGQPQDPNGHWDATRLCVMMYGPAAIGLSYASSFLFSRPSTSVTVTICIGIVNIVLVIVVGILQLVNDTCEYGIMLKKVFSFLPQFALPSSFFSLALKAILVPTHHTCVVCPDRLVKSGFVPGAPPGSAEHHPDLPLTCRACVTGSATQNITTDCYNATAPVSAFDDAVVGPEVRGLVGAAVAFPLIALGLDIVFSLPSVQRMLCGCVEPRAVDPPRVKEDDVDVQAETARVKAQDKGGGDMIQARGLRKVFRTRNREGKRCKKVAVKDMWFGIRRGDVFGFLGTNGAGKSTVFKMLSGDHMPSIGTATMCGRDILTEQIAVRRLIGYCPQHNALLPKVTVREHLRIFGLIKGVHGAKLEREVKEKIEKMDLIEFADKAAGSLSGGNKRKLCVAIALIGSPPIIFLDEPSAGMDPVAKRFMWKLISSISTGSGDTTVIMTTHSMEECSALCTRIGIMVDGRLRCIGTEQHLKDRYGHGHQLEVRLAEPEGAAMLPLLEATRSACVGEAVLGPDGALADAEGAASLVLPGAQIEAACGLLGDPARFAVFSRPGSSSWVLQDQLAAEGHVDLLGFVTWWMGESRTEGLLSWAREHLSPGARLVEQHGNSLRVQLPQPAGQGAEAVSLGRIFGLLERQKQALGLSEYCVSQTTLEQIFLAFAKEQEGVQAHEVRGLSDGGVVRDGVGDENAEEPATFAYI